MSYRDATGVGERLVADAHSEEQALAAISPRALSGVRHTRPARDVGQDSREGCAAWESYVHRLAQTRIEAARDAAFPDLWSDAQRQSRGEQARLERAALALRELAQRHDRDVRLDAPAAGARRVTFRALRAVPFRVLVALEGPSTLLRDATIHTHFAVRCAAAHPSLDVVPRPLLETLHDALTSSPRAHATGHAEFDDAFNLHTYSDEFARELFDRQLRELLLRFDFDAPPTLRVRDGMAVLSTQKEPRELSFDAALRVLTAFCCDP